MIYFNGVSLESVAPIQVEDIRVSPIAMNVTARQRPIRWGQVFARMTGESRTAVITFALLTNDITTRQRQLKDITRWARSDQPGRMELPYHDNLYLECICTGLPAPSTRQWWESQLSLTFTTMGNPYWTSTSEKSADCGTEFFVGGDAPPLMRIERTLSAAASDQAYSDGTDTMTFSTIPAGALTIDLNSQTAAVGITSIMQYYTLSSAFIQPKTGIQTITGTGNVIWRERWE